MPEKKKHRRSNEDMMPILENHKRTFQEWPLVGGAGLMLQLYSDEELESLRECALFPPKISEAVLHDADAIRRYGENLRNIRNEQGLTLDGVASSIAVSLQELQQIEKGQRDKIDRNMLLLLSGVYRVSPEVLLGFEKQLCKTTPMLFNSEEAYDKAYYILDGLNHRNNDLLDAFIYLAGVSTKMQNRLITMFKAIPALKVLKPAKVVLVIQKKPEPVYPDPQKPADPKSNWIEYFGILCELSKSNPKLLDVYISIVAAGEKTWNDMLTLILHAGFLPNFQLSVKMHGKLY